jgi:formamidopyrimidine-DNA glycosylase
MPELPEVETVARELRAAGVVGRRIVHSRVFWPRTVAEPSARAFVRGVKGQRIASLDRRGKYLVIHLAGGSHVLVHLRMTGQLCFATGDAPRGKHEHLTLGLDDGRELRFRDTRKFGRWYLLADAETKLGALGPEPLSPKLTGRAFGRRLAARKAMLKPLLLDQAFLAGLGNIYVDEALWDAGLHPRRKSDSLREEQRRRLYRSIRKVLRRGIESMGTTLGPGLTNFRTLEGGYGNNKDNLSVFRKAGQPCPRCGTAIRRMVVAQRGTHICPRCQRARGA